MSRPGPGNLASESNAPPAARRADTWIRSMAGVTVAALAGIAGAISYSHMRELVSAHGETGWQAHTFPLSVDGIEIVASLVLLADRRTGRAPGWLPWAALTAGTTASLAANIAAAGAGLVGRVVAGWPAFALLVAVKLLSGLLEPRRGADRPGNDDRPVPDPGYAWPGVPAGDDLGACRAGGVADIASSLAGTPRGHDPAATTDRGHVKGQGTGTMAAVEAGTGTGTMTRGRSWQPGGRRGPPRGERPGRSRGRT